MFHMIKWEMTKYNRQQLGDEGGQLVALFEMLQIQTQFMLIAQHSLSNKLSCED